MEKEPWIRLLFIGKHRRCIGEKEGEERGEENGQRSLGEVIKRLLSGEDKEKIRHSGVSEKTLDWALEVLGM